LLRASGAAGRKTQTQQFDSVVGSDGFDGMNDEGDSDGFGY
jgi:hypothetical protein